MALLDLWQTMVFPMTTSPDPRIEKARWRALKWDGQFGNLSGTGALLDYFLSALSDAGLVIVPREEFERLRDALESISGMWDAQTMIDRADAVLYDEQGDLRAPLRLDNRRG
jgi:hypothetical protein